jgi:DNA-binding response OmpR family regulator/nitrogen-specific signal transduction histidine kinase
VQKKHKAILEKQYQDQIDKIKEAKIQFFINISHEIRTPLTIIVCSIERLIRNLTLNTEQEKDAISVEKNVNQMLSLTNELLEIQKMEIGNYQINVRNNDIVEFIKNLVFAIEPLANRQKIKLTFSSFKPSYFIWHDSNALEKAVINLISNAIKYTKTGGKVIVSINPSINNEYLEISVIDNGIGIKKENLSKIFDRFYHLSVNTDSYENGFGIGLSLTKNLIELHKGLISVKSEPEKGSDFTISLPMNEDTYSSEEKADKVIWKSDNLTTLRSINKGAIPFQEIDLLNKKIDELDAEKTTVLYIDDNIELLKIISNYLLETYNVVVAPNGKIGIEMANQYQPDIIISDIIMPEVDGFELCRNLKNNLNTSHIPIILLTARGDSESQFKGLEIGADYYFPKPFNINLLGLTIKNLIDSREKLRELFKNNTYKNPQDITTNSRDAEFLEKLIKYVDEHIGETELNINYLAQNLAMSRSTFFRKIKAITGTTGKEFVDSIRLKKAAELLIHSEMNISEVAYTIGHSNPQYFSKWFKAYYKVSPSEYILNNKSAK